MANPRGVQVAFPTCGKPIPDPGLFDTPKEFRNFANAMPRAWIRHLALEQGSGQTHSSSVLRVQSNDLSDFSTRLYRAGLLSEFRSFLVKDLECPSRPSTPDCDRGCASYAITPDASWIGDSHQLAIAVGMVAAAKGHAVPPWVLFSADLLPGTLTTGTTNELQQKVRIALGQGPGYEHLGMITERMYALPDTDQCLGLHHERAEPGRVKLLVVAASAQVGEWKDFATKQAELDLWMYRGLKPRALREHVAKQAGDGLLLAPVTSVAEALALIGCDSVDEPPVGTLRAYHLRPCNENSAEAWNARLDYLRELHDEFCQACKKEEKDALEFLLRLTCHELNRSLEQSGQNASCIAGHVALVNRRNDKHVMMIQAAVGKAKSLTKRYPGDVGLTRRVLDSGETQIAENYQTDPTYLEVRSQSPTARELYSHSDGYEGHMQFLEQVKSMIKVPVKYEGKVIGVLSLHCDNVVDRFDAGLIKLLEKLADEANSLVGPLLELGHKFDVEGGQRPNPASRSVGTYLDWIVRTFQPGPLVHAPQLLGVELKKLGKKLTDLTLREVNAYRTAVRLFDPDRRHLKTIAWSGEKGDEFPDWFRDELHPHRLDEDSAANHALVTGKHYYIDESSEGPLHYKEVPPLNKGCSHASVILQHRGHPLGVLSIDWQERRWISSDERGLLEQLAFRCAIEMKSAIVTATFGQLHKHLNDPSEFLKAVGTMVGASWMALYRRDPKTGLFDLAASHGHSTDLQPARNECYRRGEGWVGWVASQRKTLRIANRNDTAQIENYNPPPGWAKGKEFDKDFADKPVAWMGVPITLQWAGSDTVASMDTASTLPGDVFGVMRFASENKSGKQGFSETDQSTAEAAIARLADHLAQSQDAFRRTKLLDCGTHLFTLSSPRALARTVSDIIQQAVGETTVGFRLLDWAESAEGGRCEVFRRLYMSDPSFRRILPLVRPREGGGISAHIVKTGKGILSLEKSLDHFRGYGIDEPTAHLIRTHGVHYCDRLVTSSNQVLGTVGVARRNEFSLSKSDSDFLSALVRLAGAALGQTVISRRQRLELALRKALLERRAPGPFVIEAAAGRAILGAVLEMADIPDGEGIVWVASAGGLTPVGRGQVGGPLTSGTESLAGDHSELSAEAIGLVWDPEHDQRFLRLLGPLNLGEAELSRQHRAVVPLLCAGRLIAVIAVVAPADETLGLQDLESARDVLSEIIGEYTGR